MVINEPPEDGGQAAAQQKYDESPELRALLGAAAQSPTVRRDRRPAERWTGQDTESDQSWFWTPDSKAGEQEASDDIAAGRVTRYPSAEDFLASIGFGPLTQEEADIAVEAAIHAVEAHRFAEYDATGEPVPRPEHDALRSSD